MNHHVEQVDKPKPLLEERKQPIVAQRQINPIEEAKLAQSIPR